MSKVKRIKLDNEIQKENDILYPIISDVLTDDTALTEVYIDTIKDPKDISKVIININSVLPIPDLIHLKRVCGKDVILFPVDQTTKENLCLLLQERGFDMTCLENNIRTVMVAKFPPLVRKQYEKVKKLWPCNFHSNKYLEKLSTNTLFSPQELAEHILFMEVTLCIAKLVKQFKFSMKSIGSIVVDPKLSSVVAIGFDQEHEGPCRHCVMVALDNVAKTQNGGAWACKSPTTYCLNEFNTNGIPPELVSLLQQKFPQVKFGANQFKEKIELDKPADGPYLCTGYYLYITHEPCVMCSMALVHSRIKRLFYGTESNSGGLKTHKIHTVKDLNHHYEVFGGLMKRECQELC